MAVRDLLIRARAEGDARPIDKMNKSMDNLKSKSGGASGAMKLLGANISKAGKATTKAGKSLTKGLTVPIVALGTAALASFTSLEKGASNIAQRTGAVGDELQGLEKQFKNVFKTVPDSVDNVSKVLGALYKGTDLTGKALEEATSFTLDYARVNDTEATQSVELLTRMMKGLDLQVTEMPHLMDMMTKAAQESGIEVDSLTQYVIDAGPAFEEMGFGVEESIALFSQLHGAGAEPTEMLSSLNIMMGKWAGEGVTDFKEAYNDLIKEIANTDDIAEAAKIGTEALGARAGIKIADDMRAGLFDIDEWLMALQGADGTVRSTAEAMETFGDKLIKLKNEMSVTLEPFGEAISLAMEDGVTAMKPMFDWLNNLSEGFKALEPEQREQIVAFAGIAAAIGPVIAIIGGLMGAIGTIISVGGTLLSGAGAIVTFFSGPVGWAIAGLIAVGVALYRNWEVVKDFMISFAENISGGFTDMKNDVISVFDGINSAVSRSVEWVQEKWQGLKDFLAVPIKAAVNIGEKVGGWVGSKIGKNYRGTNNWRGGLTHIHERGGEIMDLPGGTRIYPHDKSVSMARQEGVTHSRSSNTQGDFKPTININVNGGDTEKTVQELKRTWENLMSQYQKRNNLKVGAISG